jgi:hypothetical protein
MADKKTHVFQEHMRFDFTAVSNFADVQAD